MKAHHLVALLIIQIMLYGCSEKYAFNSVADIDGINIHAGLVHDHHFLAEYERYIVINNGGRIHLGRDPGGRAYINIYNLNNAIVLQSFWQNIIVIDKNSLKYAIETRPLKAQELAAFYGKFHFTRPGKYEFTHKHHDPMFEPKVLKGG